MMNQHTEHKRAEDPGPEARVHRRATDTGVRGWIHRNLGWVSYLILVLAIAFSLNNVRNESAQRRTEIVQATQNVIYDSCERGNDTRALLRDLVREGNKNSKKYLEEGLLTKAQYKRAIALNADAVRKLADVDCKASVKTVAAQQQVDQ